MRQSERPCDHWEKSEPFLGNEFLSDRRESATVSLGPEDTSAEPECPASRLFKPVPQFLP